MRPLALGLTVVMAAWALSPAQRIGRRIYRKGEDGSTSITALLRNTGVVLPGASFACINCHGESAEGLQEGGIVAPPITWEARRLNDEAIRRAISRGVSPSGSKLDAAMPEYRMTPNQMSSLLAYLKIAGTPADGEPGVSDDRVRIGSVVPLSGAQAVAGRAIGSALAASVAAINQKGGIYGRTLQLTLEDSQSSPDGIRAAARRLVEGDIFAAVGSFDPDGIEAGTFEIAEVPLIGPVTAAPRSVAPDSHVLYLLPGPYEQARVLVDFALSQSRQPGLRLATIHSSNAANREAALGIAAQARIRGVPRPLAWEYRPDSFDPLVAISALRSTEPQAVFFFGSPADFGALSNAMQRSGSARAPWGCLPITGGDESSADSAGRIATAASMVLIEGLRIAGRKLTRGTFLKSVRRIHDFVTPGLPAISFGSNRGVGLEGAYVIGFDQATHRYIRLSPLLIPEEASTIQ